MQLLFAQISKVTELPDGTCEVIGIGAAEIVDKSKEIMDWDTAVPQIQKWSQEASERSQGKSVGNVRAMHTKVAAGKLTNISFDDNLKQVQVIAKITDPVSVLNCK